MSILVPINNKITFFSTLPKLIRSIDLKVEKKVVYVLTGLKHVNVMLVDIHHDIVILNIRS